MSTSPITIHLTADVSAYDAAMRALMAQIRRHARRTRARRSAMHAAYRRRNR